MPFVLRTPVTICVLRIKSMPKHSLLPAWIVISEEPATNVPEFQLPFSKPIIIGNTTDRRFSLKLLQIIKLVWLDIAVRMGIDSAKILP